MSLVASAHMRLKQKRASPRAASSPGGVASPRNSAAALSPRHAEADGDIEHVGTVEESPVVVATLPEGVRRNVRASAGGGILKNPQPGYQHSQQQQQQFARPPASPGRGRAVGHGVNALDTSGEYVVDGHHNAQFQPPPSPTGQPPQRPPPSPPRAHYTSAADQSFESATRYQGSYTRNLLPNHRAPRAAHKPRRRYDSITGAPSDASDGDVMDDSSVACEAEHGTPAQQAFDPFGASPRASPADGMFPPRASPAFPDGGFPQQQMGSMNLPPSPGHQDDMCVADDGPHDMSPPQDNPALATGNDEFVYEEDAPTPLTHNYDFEYHTDPDEGSALGEEERQPRSRNNLGIMDEATVGSEQAQAGTPIKKKERADRRKKRRGHKSKVVIDNAPVEGGEEPNAVVEESLASGARRDIAAHARRIAAGDDSVEGSVGDSANSERGLPPRLPQGRKRAEFLETESVGSGRARGSQPLGASKSWDSQDRGRGGMNAPSFGSFAKDAVWEEGDEPASNGGKTGAGGITKLVRASRSWDEDHSSQGSAEPRKGIQTFGTWGDRPAGEEVVPKFGGAEGSDKENLEAPDESDARALAAWDKAEKEAAGKERHPWNDPGVAQPVDNVGFAAFETDPDGASELTGSALSGTNRRRESADNSEDDDSIFAFEKGRRQQDEPKSIFGQINSGLKQANKAKKRSLGLQPLDSEGSNVSEDVERMAKEEEILKGVQESPASETSLPSADARGHRRKESSGQRISFATESPRVHRYINKSKSEDTGGSNEISLSEKIQDETKARGGRQDQVRRSRSLSPGGTNEETDDDGTFESTLGDESRTYNSAVSEGNKEEYMGLLGHVEEGLLAIGGMLGLGAAAGAASNAQGPKKEARGANGGGAARANGSGRNAREADEDNDTLDNDTFNDTLGESTLQSTQYTGQTSNTKSEENDWLGSLGDQIGKQFTSMLFPQDVDDMTSATSRDLGSRYSGSYYNEESTSNDDDTYLLQQALAAARAVHHVQGVEYDVTQEINVMSDIKFVVATVKLPLGLLFQEHEIGVWVSRVVPDGNGCKRGVQHGDQLAAINGKSAVHNTIDEVASAISSTPTKTGVELTFLRYVGPLRPMPGSVIQEGFEVTDASVSPGRKMKNKLFSRRSSAKNTPPASPGTSARRFGLPKSPKRSPGEAGASAASASKQGADIALPELEPAGGQQKQSSKKKKGLGKMLSFKKKS